jgi:hypothetical protein
VRIRPGLVVAVAIALGATTAAAEAWRARPSARPAIAAAAKKTGKKTGKSCGDRLGNQVYRCQARSEGGGTFQDCFRFTLPGILSDKFDMTSDLLDGAPLGCTCKARGTGRKTRFNALPIFTCTGDADATLFEGTVSRNRKKIAKGFAANPEGGSFVFTCKVDPACAIAP